MVEIKLHGGPERRPWITRLTGVEKTEDGKSRFTRDFDSGTSVTRRYGTPCEFTGLIQREGIYEVCEADCRYYLVICGTRKDLIWNNDIFPPHWRDYMRENGCSYEEVWEHAWGTLCNRFQWLRMKVQKHETPDDEEGRDDERTIDEQHTNNTECSL